MLSLIKEEPESDYEDDSGTEVGVEDVDPEGTSIVVSDVSIIYFFQLGADLLNSPLC